MAIRVIGLDPGLRSLGFGLIDLEGAKLRHVAHGTINPDPNADMAVRLCHLFRGLCDLFDLHAPHEAAVETVFVNKDAGATLKLGQARGIALLAPAMRGLKVFEYAPNHIKKAVVGVGHADKEQVVHMVKRLLPGVTIEAGDAADALAIAICHAHHIGGRAGAARLAELRLIARLKGILDSIGEDHLVIDVQGVGYLVHCSAKTLARLPGIGEGLILEIETRLREDALQLFGFLSAEERAWFRLLQDVQGVGAKVALSILSALSPPELWQAVRQNDKATLARAPGVGPKLAARLAMELKDKASPPYAETSGGAPIAAVPRGTASEAASALVNLGYKAGDADRAVQAALAKSEAGTPVGQLIRLALRELAR